MLIYKEVMEIFSFLGELGSLKDLTYDGGKIKWKLWLKGQKAF